MLFQDLVPQGASVLDIGTGPGLPAWPLACARPDLQVIALDSNGKMIAFLQSVPLPNLQAVLGRAEELVSREVFDVVTGRAVAPLAEQVEISAPQCRIGGLLLPMRTAKDKALNPLSVRELGLALRAVHSRTLPVADAVRVFPEFEKVAPTPYKYPRPWKMITKRPFGETFDPLLEADVQPR